jgi:hypothetical protein
LRVRRSLKTEVKRGEKALFCPDVSDGKAAPNGSFARSKRVERCLQTPGKVYSNVFITRKERCEAVVFSRIS